MVQNESRPVPVMADCQFGYRTKWKISRSGIQKRTVLEMGAITGNGEGEKVLGQVMMLKGANSSAVIEAVIQRVSEIQKTLPPGISINPVWAIA